MLGAKPLVRAFSGAGWPDRLAWVFVVGCQLLTLLLLALLPFVTAPTAGPAATGSPSNLGRALPLSLFLGLVYLGSGLWVLALRPRDSTGRAFALFSAAAGAALGVGTLPGIEPQLAWLQTVAFALVGGSLVHPSFVFPQGLHLLSTRPALRWMGYPLAALLIALSLPANPGQAIAGSPPAPQQPALLFAALAMGVFLGSLVWRRYAARSPLARAQARLTLWGALAAFGPLSAWLVYERLRPGAALSPFLLVPLAIFPLVTAYAVLRNRLGQIDFVLSRAGLYALLTLLVGAGYALLVAGVSLVLGQPLAPGNPVLLGALALAIALGLNPLRERLQTLVDGVLLRGKGAFQQRLEAFTAQLNPAVDLAGILQLLGAQLDESLQPALMHIFVLDPLSHQYLAAPAPNGEPSSDMRFSSSNPLVQTLARRGSPFFVDRAATIPRALQSDWARLALLGAHLFVPLPGRQQLAGWLALGPRRTGEAYSDRELAFVETISDLAAQAIDRAQVVADLERRITEMNVLTRVAQGVNITLAFDDLLELVYAQTNQVLPLDDFQILLKSSTGDSHSHAFYLENQERLSDRENQPLPGHQGLAREVLTSGRGLVTDDYGRECSRRAILPITQGVYAWMGVPLHTGAETIGVLSLGSRDPAVLYTSQQRDFLQAVADQAAGAIAKARLLEETELRARQLASLNDIARSLVSTLELEPLLDQILSSAVEILDCEAGSLFLVDEETGELVFKVTAGPVAQDLAGQRLPPGTGLVGKAVDLGEALIANKVHEEAGWFGQTDADTGFTTRGLLVVPLQIKDRIIGVIEVINKRNQTPFAPDDQELLTVFTGQAAVAIENARLYTLTDQALAARVDELSVMQRVDRELNTSLEVGHAMRIALDWSVRQSGSDAGLVGLVAGDQLQIIAHHGYAPPPTEQLTLESLPVLQEATVSGTSRLCNPTENGAQAPLLPAANSQLAVPIRREAQVIGLLLLESAAAAHFQQDMIDFLTRLSDHAAIAISNAQLYSEVQEANLAKSDFVSFVSHELKTPMTSIKGYADLLANEAVGPITDAQANFLATIRSNVNRMATLVSDLTDISRIEAGRLRLEFGVVSMAEVVEEVVRSTLQQVEEKEQSLRVEVPYRLPSVWGDRTRLIQIVTNLVSNAHKYTPRGGEIIIRARRTANHWDRQGAPQVVHLSVEDNGIGIKEQDHAQIFQKFFRSEDQKAREAPGTGLGLNITKNLVEMQRGRIWFDSVYREGTTFHFTIPVVEEDLQPDESNQDG